MTTYHHGDLRRALLDAAARLVRAGGAARTSLREIAREAGVSHAAPYHHFPDRESLLAEVAAGAFEGLRDALAAGAAGVESGAGPLQRLQGAGVAYVCFAAENPHLYRLMFGGLLSDRTRYPSLARATDEAFAVLLRLMGEEGAREGAMAGPVALATWSTVHGLASLLIEGLLAEETATTPIDEIARQVTTVLGLGLKSYAAAPPHGDSDR